MQKFIYKIKILATLRITKDMNWTNIKKNHKAMFNAIQNNFLFRNDPDMLIIGNFGMHF